MEMPPLTGVPEEQNTWRAGAGRHPWPWHSTFVAALAATALLQGFSLLLPMDSPSRLAVGFASLLAAVAFGISSILVALKFTTVRRERMGWLAIALALALFILDMRWLHNDVHATVHYWWSYLFCGLAYLPLWTGLLLLPEVQHRHSFGRLILLLEMLIFVITTFSLVWFFLVGPSISAADRLNEASHLMNLVAAVMDLATLVGAVALLFRYPATGFLVARALLTVAVLVKFCADISFFVAEYTSPGAPSNAIDVLWQVSYVLFGVAALAHVHRRPGAETPANDTIVPASSWHIMLPNLLVAVAGLVVLVIFLGERRSDIEGLGLIVGTMLVLFLVMLRQWLTFEENRRLYRELHAAYREMAELAQTDPITRLPNYRSCMERLEEEIVRADRYHGPLALIFADLDLFKLINDSYGHRIGDVVLRAVGDTLKRQIRTVDFLARYGGEEFVILLPETTLEQAEALAERLRSSIEELRVPLEQGGTLQVTISLGVSAYPDPSPSLEALINDSDTAMYRVKRAGRNGVSCAPPHLLDGIQPLLPFVDEHVSA